jgi:hypothetical protein
MERMLAKHIEEIEIKEKMKEELMKRKKIKLR